MTTIGEALVAALYNRGVEVVFGIPGVHTIELYRGLAASGIKHVTPRHEQSAGFMADGYARVSRKPGVAFVITGPGLTNTLTSMAQARADSVPMLVVSSVNATDSLGKGLGFLHELPDQQALAKSVALSSVQISSDVDLEQVLEAALVPYSRPGPHHIELPLDIAGLEHVSKNVDPIRKEPQSDVEISGVIELVKSSKAPVILAGGGANMAAAHVTQIAELIDAPIVQTVNARGIAYNHPLGVPASPSLKSVRNLIEDSDLVFAIGTELGPTDYDMYSLGFMPNFANLIRIDVCSEQLDRHQSAIKIEGPAERVLPVLIKNLPMHVERNGKLRADTARQAAWEELGSEMRSQTHAIEVIRDALPNSIFVGDSTQPIYAANLYYDHDRTGGWFNAATGYGALGFAIPAAIGASFAANNETVVCLIGDGGAQFTLPELMTAKDENRDIVFIIWNNHGYQEIASSMKAANVAVVGCNPSPPNFEQVAASCGMPFFRCTADPVDLSEGIKCAANVSGPRILEITA